MEHSETNKKHSLALKEKKKIFSFIIMPVVAVTSFISSLVAFFYYMPLKKEESKPQNQKEFWLETAKHECRGELPLKADEYKRQERPQPAERERQEQERFRLEEEERERQEQKRFRLEEEEKRIRINKLVENKIGKSLSAIAAALNSELVQNTKGLILNPHTIQLYVLDSSFNGCASESLFEINVCQDFFYKEDFNNKKWVQKFVIKGLKDSEKGEINALQELHSDPTKMMIVDALKPRHLWEHPELTYDFPRFAFQFGAIKIDGKHYSILHSAKGTSLYKLLGGDLNIFLSACTAYGRLLANMHRKSNLPNLLLNGYIPLPKNFKYKISFDDMIYGYTHGDAHLKNIFVHQYDNGQWKVTFIDNASFGLMDQNIHKVSHSLGAMYINPPNNRQGFDRRFHHTLRSIQPDICNFYLHPLKYWRFASHINAMVVNGTKEFLKNYINAYPACYRQKLSDLLKKDLEWNLDVVNKHSPYSYIPPMWINAEASISLQSILDDWDNIAVRTSEWDKEEPTELISSRKQQLRKKYFNKWRDFFYRRKAEKEQLDQRKESLVENESQSQERLYLENVHRAKIRLVREKREREWKEKHLLKEEEREGQKQIKLRLDEERRHIKEFQERFFLMRSRSIF